MALNLRKKRMVHRGLRAEQATMRNRTIRYLEASYSNAILKKWNSTQADAEAELQENTD